MSTPISSGRTYVLASRASQLAQVQTFSVRDTFENIYAEFEELSKPKFATEFMSTAGDKNQSQALYLLGGKALWTKELEVALKEKRVDLLVHCLKDVPTTLPEGCLLGAILEREDPVDSLVVKAGEPWKSLGDLPHGSVVGTSSVRRVAQLRRRHPHLKFLDARGNLNTRLAKLDATDSPFAALVLAKAGLVRLGLGHRITADLRPPTMMYAVSQGALGIEIRSDDDEALEICRKLTHRPTQLRCLAERECLRVLEGGCSVPVGVHSELQGDELKITGCVTSLNGEEHVEHTIGESIASPEDAEEVGRRLAQVLLSTGAKKILADINVERDRRIVQANAEDEIAATSH